MELPRFALTAFAVSMLTATLVGTTPASAAIFDVKKFGAKGDGVTNDQVAIQNAFDAASASQGGKVGFPAGTYLHSGPLVGNKIQVLGKQGEVTLKATSTNAAVKLTGLLSAVEGLTFSTTAPGGIAMQFENATNCKVRKVTVNAGFNTGIKAVSCLGPTFDNNVFAIGADGDGILIESCNTAKVLLSLFRAASHNVFGNHPAVKFFNCNSVEVEDVKFEFHDVGVQVDSTQRAVVARNTFTNVGLAVVSNNSSTVSVQRNGISNVQTIGIDVNNSGGTFLIDGNKLSNCGLAATATPAVIRVDSPNATSVTIDNDSYTGNTNNLTYFILCYQNQGKPTVSLRGNTTTTTLPNKVGQF